MEFRKASICAHFPAQLFWRRVITPGPGPCNPAAATQPIEGDSLLALATQYAQREQRCSVL